MDEEEMAACSFCNVKPMVYERDHYSIIRCRRCHMQSPMRETSCEARKAWRGMQNYFNSLKDIGMNKYTLDPCPACGEQPKITHLAPNGLKHSWEIKTIIRCENELCVAAPKVTGVVTRRNQHLAVCNDTKLLAERKAVSQWPPKLKDR